MKEPKPAAINDKTTALRIAYKKLIKPVATKQMVGDLPVIRKKKFPEFNQHQIKPKRFDFF
jgi:hypothetical protein